jgi:IS1 family transposase
VAGFFLPPQLGASFFVSKWSNSGSESQALALMAEAPILALAVRQTVDWSFVHRRSILRRFSHFKNTAKVHSERSRSNLVQKLKQLFCSVSASRFVCLQQCVDFAAASSTAAPLPIWRLRSASAAPPSTMARWRACVCRGWSWTSRGPTSAASRSACSRTIATRWWKGDQYTFVGLASAARAIISYRTGKRDTENTLEFIHDLRERVIGMPEISTDGFTPYQTAIRDVFAGKASHGVIVKTYHVTNLAVKDAARRYSPAEVVAVEREVVSGIPAHISTSYVERSNLTLRMSSKRFSRLSNGFSKRLEPHCAAISLYVMHYNFCRVHESLKATPAMALGIAERVWTIAELVDAALATQPITPKVTPSDRRKRFRVIQGDLFE